MCEPGIGEPREASEKETTALSHLLGVISVTPIKSADTRLIVSRAILP